MFDMMVMLYIGIREHKHTPKRSGEEVVVNLFKGEKRLAQGVLGG